MAVVNVPEDYDPLFVWNARIVFDGILVRVYGALKSDPRHAVEDLSYLLAHWNFLPFETKQEVRALLAEARKLLCEQSLRGKLLDTWSRQNRPAPPSDEELLYLLIRLWLWYSLIYQYQFERVNGSLLDAWRANRQSGRNWQP